MSRLLRNNVRSNRSLYSAEIVPNRAAAMDRDRIVACAEHESSPAMGIDGRAFASVHRKGRATTRKSSITTLLLPCPISLSRAPAGCPINCPRPARAHKACDSQSAMENLLIFRPSASFLGVFRSAYFPITLSSVCDPPQVRDKHCTQAHPSI